MPPSVPTCPHCGAPLATSRFAAAVLCAFCGATVRIDPAVVLAGRYHEAWREWNGPEVASRWEGTGGRRVAIGEQRWAIDRLLAHGETADVFLARRARWPSELVVLKALRETGDAPLLDGEWRTLEALHASDAAEGMDLAMRVPFPVARGVLEGWETAGRPGAVYRWAPGFVHTFEAVRQAYPGGIAPVSSIWVWRRLLETLGVLRRAGLAHGAVLPCHLLVQNGEHGVRMVGFGCAEAEGSPLRAVVTKFEGFYPRAMLARERVSVEADVMMSARCIAYLLGGSGRGGEVPSAVPVPLAQLLDRTASDDGATTEDPWSLWKRLGEMAKELFGPPAFHPIAMN